MKEQVFISVVTRLKNNAPLLEGFLEELQGILAPRYTDYEIILVDDGSTDLEGPKLEVLLNRYDCVRYLPLSRSFGREISIYAGMQAAIGDYVVILSFETDPPSLIPEIVTRAAKQGGIVFGVCRNRLDEGILFKAVKSFFTWFSIRILRIPLEKDATQFMAFSRQALNALVEIKDHYRHIRLFTAYIGYNQESFEYQQIPRGGKVSHRPVWSGIGVGIRIIFASSSVPLRLASWLVMVISILYLCYALSAGDFATAFPMAVMFFSLSLLLVIIAEYLGCLIEGSHDRPLYYLREEKNSSVIFTAKERRNVTRQIQ